MTTISTILDCPDHLICSSHPTRISINCALVVNTSHLLDCKDFLCDDCGVWTQTKTATNHLQVSFHMDGSVKGVTPCTPTSKNCLTLVRRHYTCKSSPNLFQFLLTLVARLKTVSLYNEPVSILFNQVQPHGNSRKSLKGYRRTCPSTVKDLKEQLKSYPPNVLFLRLSRSEEESLV